MSLPFLPGMSLRDPTQANYARTQSLNYRNGVAVHDGRARPAKDAYSAAPPPPAWKTASGETPPPWLAYEKKVLKFDAYFMESIPYSREPYRVRKCTIIYHLEDGTLSVLEPKVPNSGLPQGTVVKRHRATKEDGTQLSYQDINTCIDLRLHGIKYRLYETTDPFTIQFMEEMGFPINGFEECPPDPHSEQREFMARSMRPVRPAKSGKDPLRQFLDYDGKVLRYYCLLLDSRQRNERRTFMLQFFLADDSLSVVENLPPNCGRDPAPVFAKRQTPPKDFPPLEDIRIGQTITIFNHKFMIYDIDTFTRDYYGENFGLEDFSPIDVTSNYEPEPQADVPQYNGFGTEEDSLSSCLSLIPKPPRRDIAKGIENDGKILRFGAKLSSDKPIDATRNFVVSFYMADDTIAVFEPPQRNSGIVGGKFLERRRVKRPLKPPQLAPPIPSSPARPHTTPGYLRTASSLDPPASPSPPPTSPLRRPSTSSSSTSPTTSPTLTRSPSPYSFSAKGYGFATTSNSYGTDIRKDLPSAQGARAGTPPLSPSARAAPAYAQSPPGTPPSRAGTSQGPRMSTPPLSPSARQFSQDNSRAGTPPSARWSSQDSQEGSRAGSSQSVRWAAQDEPDSRGGSAQGSRAGSSQSVRFSPSASRAQTSLAQAQRTTRNQSRTRSAATHDELATEYYSARDFYLGGLIQIFNHVFVLQDASEYALQHMEAHPDEFPVADINRIISRLRDEMENKADVIAEWLRELDPARTGYISRDAFRELLQCISPDLVEQEVLTVCRRYDMDGKGQIAYDEFYTAVAPRDDF